MRLFSESLEDRRLLAVLSIAQENQLPGTSPDEWDISGSGTANIQGFAAEFSVDHGERVDFKIDTDATAYHIDIYRMGYYQGLGARKVATIDPNATLANNQPDPITDFNTGLVDAGNWRVSASWDVPATAVSGVYIAKLTREDGTFGESHIIFVVRDDESHSDLLMQTSDTNWVAYSDYGGSSLYGNNFMPPGRAYEVSYNRPLTTRDRANTTFFFGAEYPMVRFLEENGYDVSYTTGIDTDRRGAGTARAQGVHVRGARRILVGPAACQCRGGARCGCEPGILQRQRDVLEDALGRQHCRTDDSVHHVGELQRDSRQRQDRPARRRVDRHLARSSLRPQADGGHPENAVTGTLFMVNGDSVVGRPMTVGSADGQMRFWRNTQRRQSHRQSNHDDQRLCAGLRVG